MNVYDYYITPEEYETAKQNGISPFLLEQRIRSLGWKKPIAIHKPPQKKNRIKEWVPIAEQHGICYSTLRYRINQLGMEPELAATKPLQDRQKQAKTAYEKSRVYPKEFVDLAKANNIPYDTFRRRTKTMSYLDAATKPLMTPSEIGLMTKEKRQKK